MVVLTLQSPNNTLDATDLGWQPVPGYSTNKAGGGITVAMGSYSSGSLTLTCWDQTVVPPVVIDANIQFTVKRRFKSR